MAKRVTRQYIRQQFKGIKLTESRNGRFDYEYTKGGKTVKGHYVKLNTILWQIPFQLNYGKRG